MDAAILALLRRQPISRRPPQLIERSFVLWVPSCGHQTVDSAKDRNAQVLLARIAEQHIHFVGREDADLTGLHAANLLQTSDVVRSAQTGLVIGGVAGAVLGVVVGLFFPLFGTDPEWGMVAVLSILGAVFGAWASSMIGISTPSSRLKRFEPAIEESVR